MQKTTYHIATLPRGHIGYIEVPITNEKPIYYQINDITTRCTFISSLYYRTFSTIKLQFKTQDGTSFFSPIFNKQVSIANSDTPLIKSHFYNVQPT